MAVFSISGYLESRWAANGSMMSNISSAFPPITVNKQKLWKTLPPKINPGDVCPAGGLQETAAFLHGRRSAWRRSALINRINANAAAAPRGVLIWRCCYLLGDTRSGFSTPPSAALRNPPESVVARSIG